MSTRNLDLQWQTRKVSQVCDINPIVSIAEIDSALDIDFVPMAAIDETIGVIAYLEKRALDEVSEGKTKFKKGDILFAKITPCTENGKVALVAHLDSPIGFGSTEFYVLRVTKTLTPEYLLYWLRSPTIRELAVSSMTGSSGRQRVPKTFWDEVDIPIPPLPVQRAIVTILSQADTIRCKHIDAANCADDIILTLFMDIFGNPLQNPRHWQFVSLGELGDIVSGVTKGRHLKGVDTVEVPYLRVANVQDGYLELTEIKTIKVLPTDVEKYRLVSGDVLLTEGGDPDKLGRGYIWNNEIAECIHQNHIFRVRLNPNLALPLYIATLLRTVYAKAYFLKAAKLSSNLASINKTQLSAFPVPLPSVELQKQFVDSVEQFLAIQNRLEKGVQVHTELLSVLQHRAFTGELTAEWEATNVDLIATEVARLAQRPRLALLTLVAEQQRRTAAPLGITSLMKYTFLAQQEGQTLHQPINQFYDFVPYHFGPFAKDIYGDLEQLEAEGWLTIRRASEDDPTAPEKVEISLSPERAGLVNEAIAELNAQERVDLVAAVEAYGGLSHKDLLVMVYEKYPAYARKSLRK